MFFLYDIAEFNRQINIKAHTRIINGKVVPVKGARRMVMRLREALEDLRSKTAETNIEHAYNANPRTGIVGNRMVGEETSVVSTQNYKDNPKNEYGYLKIPERHVLHSHPYNTSLSYTDFTNTRAGRTKQNFAISKSGSVYRGYAKQGSYFVSSKQVNNHFEKIEKYFDSTIGEKLTKSTHPLANVNNLIDDEKYSQTLEFLVTHTQNLFLKENGIVDYRFKLSDTDKAVYNLFRDEITSIVKNKNKLTKFNFSKDFKAYKKLT